MFKPVFSSVLLVLVTKLTITDVSVVAATLTITPIKNFQMLSPIFIHHLNLVSLAEIDDYKQPIKNINKLNNQVKIILLISPLYKTDCFYLLQL